MQKHQNTLLNLYIDNENNKELAILIKPEFIDDRTVEEEKRIIDKREGEWITLRLPENSLIEFELNQAEIGPKTTAFSVTGETNPLTPVGKCYNLILGRDYFLSFINNAFRVDCYSEELKVKAPGPFGKQHLNYAKLQIRTARKHCCRKQ